MADPRSARCPICDAVASAHGADGAGLRHYSHYTSIRWGDRAATDSAAINPGHSATRFVVQPEIFERCPDMRIAVAVARGVDNHAPHPAAEAEWQAAWAGTQEAARYGNAQSHPRVAPWRERMRGVGVSGKQFPSSIEAVLRRALKGSDPADHFGATPQIGMVSAEQPIFEQD